MFNARFNKKHPHSNGSPALWWCGLIFILCFAFFFRGVVLQTVSLIWDVADYAYPLLFFNSHYLRQGIVPLWNPLIFAGYPAFADPQVTLFYPPIFILSLITNLTPYVIYCVLAAHFLLNGIFMFSFCKHLKYANSAAALAAISYMLSGFFVGHFSHNNIIFSATWFPLALLFLDLSFSKKKYHYAFLGSLPVSLMILGGHPQTYFYGCFSLGVYWLYKVISTYRNDTRSFYFGITAGFILFGFGISLAAIQILPTWEFSKLSNRMGYNSSGEMVSLKYLATIFFPNYFGGMARESFWFKNIDITQQNLYMGVLTFLFSGWSILFSRNKRRFYFVGLAIVSLLISLGSPLYTQFLYFFPGFSKFSGTMNYNFLFHFFFSLLAADGMSSLINQKPNAKKYFFFTLGLIIFTLLIKMSLSDAPSVDQAQKTIIPATKLFIVLLFFATISVIVLIKAKNSKWHHAIVLLCLGFDLFISTSHSQTLGRTSAYHLGNQDILDTTVYLLAGEEPSLSNYRVHTGLKYDSLFLSLKNTKDLRWAYPDNALFRMSVGKGKNYYGHFNQRDFGYNRPILYGVFTLFGYSPLRVKRFEEVIAYLNKNNFKRVWDLFNIHHHLHDAGSRISNGEKIDLMRDNTINTPLDRMAFVEKAEIINNSEDILKKLADSSFDLHKTVLLEKKIPTILSSEEKTAHHNINTMDKKTDEILDTLAGNTKNIEFTSYLPNKVEVNTVTEKAGYLIFNDVYYPGWLAFIDDKETEVFRANYSLKAIHLPPGQHEVSFVFRPFSFFLGGIISCFSFLIVTIMIFMTRRNLSSIPS